MTLSDGSNGGAILYRVQNAGENTNKDFQGYGFQIATPGGAIENELVLSSFDKGSENILASVPYNPSTFSNYDTLHTVQIDVHDSTHTVSVDGEEVMRYEGTTKMIQATRNPAKLDSGPGVAMSPLMTSQCSRAESVPST